MSSQNKQKRTIAMRQQVTTAHKGSVQSTGLKRTKQDSGKARMGFTQKLTSTNKGKMGIRTKPE